MLLYLNNDNEILAYNDVLTHDEAAPYINESVIWEDDLKIDPPTFANDERIKMYYSNGGIDYVVEKIKSDIEPKGELIEILEKTKAIDTTTQLTADDNLLNMELICELDEKLNLIMDHLGLIV